MAVFVPFKALRPTADKVASIASRPYDVLNAKEARSDCKGNPWSFYHVIKPEIDFPDGFDHYTPEVYRKGKENLDRLIESGAMVKDNTARFYVYRLIKDGHSQTGLVGCCGIDDYFNNVIKKHELTRPDKEEDRKNHVRYSAMNYEPVFFSYPHNDDVDNIVTETCAGKPEYDFISEDGISHTLWLAEDDRIETIETIFRNEIPALYVADGHHRTAAGALVGREFREAAGGHPCDGNRYNYFMAVLFPDNQLQIIDYNRLVKDLNGMSKEAFIQRLTVHFNVQLTDTPCKPEKLHTIGMYLDHQWYCLGAKEGTWDVNDPVDVLDVSILSKKVLEPMLGITDLRRDKRIDFVGGIRGLEELERRVDSGEMTVAFAMYPVSMSQLIAIADRDLIMPPKVTWFEPKLRSGLFVHDLESQHK